MRALNAWVQFFLWLTQLKWLVSTPHSLLCPLFHSFHSSLSGYFLWSLFTTISWSCWVALADWHAIASRQGGLTTTSGQLKFIKVWLLGLTVANCHFENSFGSFFMLMSLLRVWLVGANSKRSLLWKSNMPLSVQGSITIPGIGGRFRFCLSWNDFFATFAFDCRLEWEWIRLWKMIAI